MLIFFLQANLAGALPEEVREVYKYLFSSSPYGGPMRVWSTNPTALVDAVDLVRTLYIPIEYEVTPVNHSFAHCVPAFILSTHDDSC